MKKILTVFVLLTVSLQIFAITPDINKTAKLLVEERNKTERLLKLLQDQEALTADEIEFINKKVAAVPSPEQLVQEYWQYIADLEKIRKGILKDAAEPKIKEFDRKLIAEDEKIKLLQEEIEEKKGVLSSSEWNDLYNKNSEEIVERAKKAQEICNRSLEMRVLVF